MLGLLALLLTACGGGDGGYPQSGWNVSGGDPWAAPGSNSSGGNTPVTPGAGGDGSAASICVDLINQYRQSIGAPPLARWSAAEACSNQESAQDAASGRAHGSFGQCGEMAQNECPGWPGPESQLLQGCLKMMWDEGPGGGHYDNMASRSYTQVACGFACNGNECWAVQNFR
jgi:hypothetical protein